MTSDNQAQNRGNRPQRREWVDGYVPPRSSTESISRPALADTPAPARQQEPAQRKRPSRKKKFSEFKIKNILPKRRRRNSLRRHRVRFAILGLVLVFALAVVGSVFLSKPPKAEAAISLRGGTNNWSVSGTTANTSVTLSKPTTSNGDIMITNFTTTGAPTISATPTGWTQFSACSQGSNVTNFAYWKEVGSSEAGPYTWTLSSSQHWLGGVVSYAGVNRTNPINSQGACTTSTASNSVTLSGFTSSAGSTYIIAAVGYTSTNGTAGGGLTSPASMTGVWNVSANSRSCGVLCTKAELGAHEHRAFSGTTSGTLVYQASQALSTGSWAGMQFALNPNADPTLEQAAYRWLVDNDSANPTTALAANNTMATGVVVGDKIRLRLLLHVSGSEMLVNIDSFKLQVATLSGTCATTPTGNFADLSNSSGAIRYFDGTPGDAASISTTAADPSHSGHTIIPQSYEELNNFTTRSITPVGQDAMWDFIITNNSAPENTTYCFRVVKASDGSTINTYTEYPSMRTINPSYTQSAYRWFANANSTTPGSAMTGSQDSQITNVKVGDSFRLRMLIHNSSADTLPAGYATYKLQYAAQSGGSCPATPNGDYNDVGTASGAIRYINNAAAADNATTVSNASDPTHGSDTTVLQYYKDEASTFTTRAALTSGQDGLWDFSLTSNSTTIRTTYCIRAVKSDASTFTTYTSYATLTTQDPRYEQSAFRWATNNDAITPGTALGANNAPITDISQNTIVRLRMLVHVSNDAATASLENFKLQFAQRSGTCDTAFSGETYTDLAQGSGEFRYKDITGLSDAAAIVANGANDPTHSSDTVVPETYEESNNFTNPTAIPVGQDGMWDFPIVNNSANQNTSWCFRIVKSDATRFDQANGSYTNIAELSTAPAALNQSAYRWYTNIDSSDFLSIFSNPSGSADQINKSDVDVSGGYMYIVGRCDGCGNSGAGRIEKRRTSDGSLVTSFDGDGILEIDPSDNLDSVTAIKIDTAGGYMYLGGYDNPSGLLDRRWRLEKRRLDTGALCTAAECGTQFGTNGVIVVNYGTLFAEQVEELYLDTTNGYLYAVGHYQSGANDNVAHIEKRRTSDGALCTAANCGTAFDTDGIIDIDPTTKEEWAQAIEVDISGGYFYVAIHDGSPGGAAAFQWRVDKRKTSTGALCTAAECGTAFDTDGIWLGNNPSGNTDHPITDLELDTTNGYLYIGGMDQLGSGTSKYRWRVEKITTGTGAHVTAFDTDGIWFYETAADSYQEVDKLNLDITNGYIYIGGRANTNWAYGKISASSAAWVNAFDTDGYLEYNWSSTLEDIEDSYLDITNGYIYGFGLDEIASGNSRWRVEKRNASDGSKAWTPTALAAQDTKASPVTRQAFRLRLLLHVSGENMPINGETLKLQYAPKVGTCDTAFVGESAAYVDVGTASTSDISYYDNTNPADGLAAVVLTTDPTHIGHTIVLETYEEQNNFTFPTAVLSGQDGLWEFALVDNSAFGNYCFRVIKSTDTNIAAYSVIPEIVFCDVPKSDNLMRHGNFFCDDSEKKFYWN